MRIAVDVDDELLRAMVELTGEKSKARAVRAALAEYVRQKRIQELLGLMGKLDLELDDWYELRHGYPRPENEAGKGGM